MTPDFSSLAQTLAGSLKLALPPIAVTLAGELPAGVELYQGRAPAGCLFWQEAANRVFATVAADHDLCAIGVYTHNLEPTAGLERNLKDALKVFAELGYVRPQDLPLIPVLNRKPAYVVYAPLGETPAPPDVVLLFVRADQMLVLSEATQQVEDNWAPALGRPACAVVAQAANSGRTAFSLGCCGARTYLDALSPDVALYALPGARLEEYVERIAALARANLTLTRFHTLRREDIAAGAAPTVAESLVRLQSAG